MRLKVSLIFATTTIISIVLFRNSLQSKKWYDSILDIHEDESKQALDIALGAIQDEIKLVYNKFESEDDIINTTIKNLRRFYKSIENQAHYLEKAVNQTVSDFEIQVAKQTEHLYNEYEGYDAKLEEILIKQANYKSVYEQMKITIGNGKKQLNETKKEIESKISKWKNIKKNLVQTAVELMKMKADFNSGTVEAIVKDIKFMVKKVKEETDEKINRIVIDMTSRVQNMSNDAKMNTTLGSIALISIKELRNVFYAVEKSMLQIDIQVQKAVESNIHKSFEIIKANKKKYYVDKLTIIEFLQDIETLINTNNSLVLDVSKDVDKLSRLKVKLLTEEGETPLDYNDEVPFFGVLPNETLASYNSDDKKSTMTNYGTRPNGSQFIREITKEEVDNKIYVTEIFYDEEGQVESEKLYEFNYTS